MHRKLSDLSTLSVIRSVAKLSDDRLESFSFVPPVERPLVIQGLLAGYDAKPIGVGLGRDSALIAGQM
ncbi:hypothetical protein CsSME_00037822 [Camellia sinensis var. sinensis]